MNRHLRPSKDDYADVGQIATDVKRASRVLARQTTSAKNDALLKMAGALDAARRSIFDANHTDLERARSLGRPDAFLDRLALDDARVDEMICALHEVADLPDPVGRVDRMWMRPNGLQVGKRRIPLGVIGIIYEARPNVTSDASSLCLKSGNGVLLKGGSGALDSNMAILHAMRDGLRHSALDPAARGALGFVPTADRDAVAEMLKLSESLDVVIPRGGKGLVSFVREHARMPVLKHDEGVCHVVVDATADPEDVDRIVLNAKTQRTGVCNAAETLLVLREAVDIHLARVLRALSDADVTLHLCPTSLERARSAGIPEAHLVPATEHDWAAEYLSMDLAVRVVDDLEDAIAHIERFGSSHTESLLTQDYSRAQAFLSDVNSSVVVVNASTRFADGGALGLGAEIGISTTRMHAYGPMGLDELTTTKFIVMGQGQIRS